MDKLRQRIRELINEVENMNKDFDATDYILDQLNIYIQQENQPTFIDMETLEEVDPIHTGFNHKFMVEAIRDNRVYVARISEWKRYFTDDEIESIDSSH